MLLCVYRSAVWQTQTSVATSPGCSWEGRETCQRGDFLLHQPPPPQKKESLAVHSRLVRPDSAVGHPVHHLHHVEAEVDVVVGIGGTVEHPLPVGDLGLQGLGFGSGGGEGLAELTRPDTHTHTPPPLSCQTGELAQYFMDNQPHLLSLTCMRH